MTIEPEVPIVPPPPPPSGHLLFSPGAFLGGLFLSLAVGLVLNVAADLAGSSTNIKATAALIGLIPGGAFIALSFFVRKNGFGLGMLIGGCIVALIGGTCGASITPFVIR